MYRKTFCPLPRGTSEECFGVVNFSVHSRTLQQRVSWSDRIPGRTLLGGWPTNKQSVSKVYNLTFILHTCPVHTVRTLSWGRVWFFLGSWRFFFGYLASKKCSWRNPLWIGIGNKFVVGFNLEPLREEN